MPNNLLIQINFLDGRYHGEIRRGKAEWPPSPGRLFQAMVAGCALSRKIDPKDDEVLRWLECQQPPIICSPETKLQAPVTAYLPNNNLDQVPKIEELAGDPYGYVLNPKTKRWAQARSLTLTKKTSQANLLISESPLAYIWKDLEESGYLQQVVKLAEKIYQLGRGIDAAWAYPQVLDDEQLDKFLENFAGQICHPGAESTKGLRYPTIGTLDSLHKRYKLSLQKFETAPTEKNKKQTVYRNPPLPQFTSIEGIEQHHFDIRHLYSDSFKAYSVSQAYAMTNEILRKAADRLIAHFKDDLDTIEQVLIGSKNSDNNDKSKRVRIIPIPTVRRDRDRDIRRVLVDLPRNCGLRLDDLRWAFSNLELSGGAVLRQAEDATLAMDNYVCESKTWQTETPVAMPKAQRRRIDPAALDSRDNLKDGSEVQAEQAAAMRALKSSLRHAGIVARIVQCAVQREPFAKHGTRAEEFATGKDAQGNIRFSKHALWHASITFAEAVQGPLVLGDGRYRGLGVFSKQFIPQAELLAFQITDGLEGSDPGSITKAFRRAVMHCVARELADSDKALPLYFCGHERDGRPAGRNSHAHLGFAFDADANLLLVVPPHLLQHQEPSSEERKNLRTLSNALARLRFVKAGQSGLIHLAPATLSVADPLVATSQLWRSATPYKPTRHGKRGKEEQGLIKDVLVEASRRNLPQPEVTVLDLGIGARGGVSAMLQLAFKRAVKGPLLLGRTMHFGGGLFKAIE